MLYAQVFICFIFEMGFTMFSKDWTHQQETDKWWHKNKLNRFDVDLHARAAAWSELVNEFSLCSSQADVMFHVQASLEQIENSFRLNVQDRWIRGMWKFVLISCLHASTVLSRLLLNTAANKIYIISLCVGYFCVLCGYIFSSADLDFTK